MLKVAIRPIRVMLVVGQVLFSKALSQLLTLESSIEIVGDTQTLDLALLKRTAPEIILLDFDDYSGTIEDSIQRCKDILPEAKVCVLTAHDRPELMQRCLGAGVAGYVAKDTSPDELVRAVQVVAAGSFYADPRIAGSLLRRRTKGPMHERGVTELSERENEIVRLIAKGLSNKEISHYLSLSEKTIKNHIGRIFNKLQINARTQAAVYAIRSGLA